MIATANQTATGQRRVTWTGPSSQEHCLDYLASLAPFGPATTELQVHKEFEGVSLHDHFPLSARVTWLGSGSSSQRQPRYAHPSRARDHQTHL